MERTAEQLKAAADELRLHAHELRGLRDRALHRDHRTKAEVYKHAMQLAHARADALDALARAEESAA